MNTCEQNPLLEDSCRLLTRMKRIKGCNVVMGEGINKRKAHITHVEL
jgi:hypothetical protein